MEGSAPVSPSGTRPRISVLIAAYNAEAFIHRAVRSVIAQTLPAEEILIVDDGSADGTLDTVNALAAQDSRIRVLSLARNGGPSAARNAGIEAAKGDWIAVLDADDAYLPTRLATLASAVSESNVDIVVDNLFFFDAARDAPTSAALPSGDRLEPVDLYTFVGHARPYLAHADWGLLKPMFRRAFLEAHALRYEESCRHGEDFLFMFRALDAGGRCVLLHTPGYLYTTRDSGMSRTTIDYKGLIRHTKGLLAEPTVRADPRLARLLRQSVAAQRRWNAEFQERSARRERDYRRLLVLALGDSGTAWRLAKTVWRRLKKAAF